MSVAESVITEVLERSRQISGRLREIRRDLHRNPDVSGNEYRTTEVLARLVSELGLNPQVVQDDRGLFVDLVNPSNESDAGGQTRGPSSDEFGQDGFGHDGHQLIAIRADMDALPIETNVQTEYASQVEGVMHACGHDAHCAAAFGALVILKELRDQGHCIKARIIFQPEEETSRGGIHMIQAGALRGVGAAISLHVDPSLAAGTIGVRDGSFTAGCDAFACEITGRGGHGARPHLTGDTIGAASQWVMDVYRRIPRVTDARDAVVVNVGSIHSGVAANVVPSSAHLSGTLRTLTPASADRAKEMMQEISHSVGKVHDCEVSLEFDHHTPPVENNREVTGEIRTAAVDLIDQVNVIEIDKPSMGAEDFSFIASRVPAAMFRLGVAGEGIGSEPLHTPKFDIDESSLPIGASVLALTALRWSQRHALPDLKPA
tara:strand:- start:196633 stop:197928 length:1296 start_codon:yes stop_codon:yes gene_type:complete